VTKEHFIDTSLSVCLWYLFQEVENPHDQRSLFHKDGSLESIVRVHTYAKVGTQLLLEHLHNNVLGPHKCNNGPRTLLINNRSRTYYSKTLMNNNDPGSRYFNNDVRKLLEHCCLILISDDISATTTYVM
jgi:hypothetical protein